MRWYVFYHDVNKQIIKEFNVFEHREFKESVEKLLATSPDRNCFKHVLRKEIQYFFWAKAECELEIHPWCGDRFTKPIKVDIHHQLMLNYDRLVDYLWKFKEK